MAGERAWRVQTTLAPQDLIAVATAEMVALTWDAPAQLAAIARWEPTTRRAVLAGSAGP